MLLEDTKIICCMFSNGIGTVFNILMLQFLQVLKKILFEVFLNCCHFFVFPISGVTKFRLGFDNRFMKNFSGIEVVSNISILFLTFHFSCFSGRVISSRDCNVCYCIVGVDNAMVLKFLISQIFAIFSLEIERLSLLLSFFSCF